MHSTNSLVHGANTTSDTDPGTAMLKWMEDSLHLNPTEARRKWDDYLVYQNIPEKESSRPRTQTTIGALLVRRQTLPLAWSISL